MDLNVSAEVSVAYEGGSVIVGNAANEAGHCILGQDYRFVPATILMNFSSSVKYI